MTISPLALDETLERMSGDRDLLVSLFELYLVDAPKKLQEIGTALSEGEFYRVERLAHSVKGASATVGAHIAQQHAASLEKAAKAQDLDLTEQLFAALKSSCVEAMDAMQEFSSLT